MIQTQSYPLNQIYFYLTEGCNLACRHCWIAPKLQTKDREYPVLPFDLFVSILSQAKALGVSGIKLTGGEPLMHPDIGRMLEYIKDEGFRLIIETNGVLCSPALTEKIAPCVGSFVSVSIDGADADLHDAIRGVSGSHAAAIEGVRNLVTSGLKPQIIMSIMKSNKDQMEPLVRMAETLGAGSVKFNLVQPVQRGERLHEQGETLTIEELVNLGQWVERTLVKTTNLDIEYDHPPAFRPLSRMFGKDGDGCQVCGILGIIGVLADGSYALCGIGKNEPELVFGHAAEDRLQDVWENSQVLQELRQGLPDKLEGVCGDCLMKERCLGKCIAQNYYRKRNLRASFWFCEQARRAGLFPSQRAKTTK